MNSVKLKDIKKVNIQKPVAFLYTSNEILESEIKKIISFTIATKSKLLRINLTKEMNDLYTENCKILTKEFKDTNKRYAHELKNEYC